MFPGARTRGSLEKVGGNQERHGEFPGSWGVLGSPPGAGKDGEVDHTSGPHVSATEQAAQIPLKERTASFHGRASSV